MHLAARRLHDELIAIEIDAGHRRLKLQLSAATFEHPLQRQQHVERPIADRKDLASLLDLRANALGFEHRDQVVRAKRREGRVEKRSLLAEGLDDAASVSRMREIAPRAAGHEDLHARLAVLL